MCTNDNFKGSHPVSYPETVGVTSGPQNVESCAVSPYGFPLDIPICEVGGSILIFPSL